MSTTGNNNGHARDLKTATLCTVSSLVFDIPLMWTVSPPAGLACLSLPVCTEVCCSPLLCSVCVYYRGLLIRQLISGSDFWLPWYLVSLVLLCTLITPIITISFPSSAMSASVCSIPRAPLRKNMSHIIIIKPECVHNWELLQHKGTGGLIIAAYINFSNINVSLHTHKTHK